MKDLNHIIRNMNINRVGHLPIVAQFCKRIDLINTVNRAISSEMDVDIGTVVQAMVLDTLSGRSPIYRLEEFIELHDTTALLGREIPAGSFNDTTVGRAIDAIYKAGTRKLFSQVALNAASAFPSDMDMQHVHFDTTSVNVWGDYDVYNDDDPEERLVVTGGYSKDKRPDLKQFMISMLCVRRNIPVLGGCENGNASDKKLNNEVLTRLSGYMANHGLVPDAFVYVADSSMVNKPNLEAVSNNLFITRLPFTYREAERVVSDAVNEGDWEDVPVKEIPSGARNPARYQVCDSIVTLYGKDYRAIVVHSNAHDKRRLGRLKRRLEESAGEASDRLKEACNIKYFCRDDAKAAAEKLSAQPSRYHSYKLEVHEQVSYVRGRPPKNRQRKVSSTRYVIKGEIAERSEKIERARREAGCFVLLTNTPVNGKLGHSPADVLAAYKEQHGIERNFGFLKDPLIVNSLFLKKPERIEVIGLILLISLLVWNLIEHVMREHLRKTESTVIGLDKRVTDKPTSFAMATNFSGLQVVEYKSIRQFTSPLTPVQEKYLEALGLKENSLLAYEDVKDQNNGGGSEEGL